jgi:hypothetical protein
MLDNELKFKLLKQLGITPVVVNPDQFRTAVNSMSVVAALIATIAFVGWLNPPGAFNNGLTMLDKGGVLRYHTALRAFFIFNSLAFFFSMGAVVTAL